MKMDMLTRYHNAEKLLTQYTREAVLNGAPRVKWLTDSVFTYGRESYDENGKKVSSPVYIDALTGSEIRYSPEEKKDRYELSLDRGNIIMKDTMANFECPLTDDAEEFYEYGVYIDMFSQITEKLSGREDKPHVCWSPDRTKFVTYLADRRKVGHEYVIKSFFEGDDCNKPELYSYPCAVVQDPDDVIPHYMLYIGDCEKRTMIKASLPDSLYPVTTSDTGSMVKWLDDGSGFYFTWLKRGYQEGRFYLVNAEDGSAELLLTETSDTFLNFGASGMMDGFGTYRFSNYVTNDRKSFIWWSERTGFAHLYRYDIKSGECIDLIGSERSELIVQKIMRIDEETGKIYFLAGNDPDSSDPYFFNLYVVDFDGNGFKRLTPEDASHSVSVGKTGFVDTYSTVETVPVTVLRDLEGNLVKELEKADATRLYELGYVTPERFKVKAKDGVTDLYGIIVRPVEPVGDTVPVVDYVYGGAQMFNVPKTFTWDNGMDREIMGGLQQFAQLGMAAIIMDGLGTPGRGKEFHDLSFRRFEYSDGLEEHVYCYSQIKEQYPFIDLDRIGIWGNSGGGYATVTGMLTYPEVYKVGVASSGNYDNRMYEHSWTERYGGLYDEDVYVRGDATRRAKHLEGKLLLAYGALDDNVTMSETIRLCDELNKYNKDYDLIVVPRKNHNVPSDFYFIRRKMDFFTRHLLGAEPPKEYRFELMK